MVDPHFFTETSGLWLKGNLHCHTTESDGKKNPQEVVDWYVANGYDFLQITDHNKVTPGPEAPPRGFVVIPSTEINGARSELGEQFHLLCLGLSQMIQPPDSDDPQVWVDAIRAQGAEVIVAHPYWSALTAGDLAGLEGVLGIEIFNATCLLLNGKGDSVMLWDELLARGKSLLGFAVDDTHWGRADYGRGWLMVRAAERSPEAILGAIRDGRFYASTGPEIRELRLADGKLHARCSPVKAAFLVAEGSKGRCQLAEEGSLLTDLEFTMPQRPGYLRLQVMDSRGRYAWTNPMAPVPSAAGS